MKSSYCTNLEIQINNNSIFDIDRTKDYSIYETVRYKILIDIYNYLKQCVYYSNKYEDIGFAKEMIETFDILILEYDKTKGRYFTHLFNSYFSKEMKGIERENKKNCKEELKGYVFTDKNNNDDKIDFFDTVTYKDDLVSLFEIDNLRKKLQKIDEIFLKQQKRSQIVISKLLTIDIRESFGQNKYFDIIINGLSFIDNEILELEENPSQRDICSNLNIKEQSASRTYRLFKEQIQSII